MKYIQEVDAIQYDGGNPSLVHDFIVYYISAVSGVAHRVVDGDLIIGPWVIPLNSWVMHDAHDRVSVVPDSVFKTIFKEVH